MGVAEPGENNVTLTLPSRLQLITVWFKLSIISPVTALLCDHASEKFVVPELLGDLEGNLCRC